MSVAAKPFGWALIGPGRIAHQFAEAVQGLETMRLVGVQGRDAGRADGFARKWTLARPPVDVFASINALISDDRVDGVYIATPHPFHAGAIQACLTAGKAVLCEKPLVTSHAVGAEVVALARDRNVFLMEAVWTRFLPIYSVVGQWLREGAIGRVRAIQSCFCFNLPFDRLDRAYDPAQAGGALLDIGVYNLTMTRWALAAAMGKCPALQSLHAHGSVGPTGVDHRIDATLGFAGGVVSQMLCGFEMNADNSFRIIGEKGAIVIPSRFWKGIDAELRLPGQDPVIVHRPFAINGFEYEIEEAVGLIQRGRIESEAISHDETLATLQWMDRIRDIVGVRYPFEGS